jgi:acyl-CoA reductase-like NAD-dependent aldehyde dehydrogenase
MTKLLIGGQWVNGTQTEVLRDRYRQEPFGEMAVASIDQAKEAVGAAVHAFEKNELTPSDRFRILSRTADIIQQRREALLETLTNETGFPEGDGENEIRRCVQTLRLCAEEAHRVVGELVPMEATPGLRNRLGYTILVPRGVVCAITPFNSPLNVVAHKIGPALAAGNAVVLKPSEHVPLSAVALCEALIEAGLPPGLISLLNGTGPEIGRALLADERIAFYAFTGSTAVGKEIQRAAGLRGTQLELGSIASTILCADADLDKAIPKITAAAFRKAGQVCTSVQRIYVHSNIAREFTDKFVAATRQIRFGDPWKKETVVGPMITPEHAARAQAWVEEAVAGGARLLVGGGRQGAVMEPTILSGVKPTMRVACQEVFAPVASIFDFDHLEDAYQQVNATPFGLAAGLFTNDVRVALSAGRRLRFGGVHINETSSSRVDVMPFGGVKDSGFGREGPRYAIREMMEERLVTIAF